MRNNADQHQDAQYRCLVFKWGLWSNLSCRVHDNDSMIVLSVVLLEMSFNTRPLSMAAHVNAESGLCYGLCLLTLVCGPSYAKGQGLVLL